MLYGLALSIRMHLASSVTAAKEVVLMRDGITLSGRAKPFLTVEALGDTGFVLSAGHRSYEEEYPFQIGIRASNIGELLKLQGTVKELLRDPAGIPLYDDDAVATGKRVVVDVQGFTPMTNDDTSNDSDNHRGYLDISVTLLRNVGSTEFTQ